MKEKILIYSFISLLFLAPLIQAPDLCSYRGYANKSGTLVNTTDKITASNVVNYNTVISSDGSYTIDVEAIPLANVSFRICGVSADQGAQIFTCSAAAGFVNRLNLSISALANSASCTYSCACSGGYCCTGATQYTNGEGTGTCQASACAAAATTSTGSSGTSEAGGGGTTVVEVTKTVSVIIPSAPEVIKIETAKAKDLKVDEVTITVKEAVSNIQVTVKESSIPSGASVAISSSSGSTYKYLDISTTVESAKVDKVKVKFKVEKSWLTSNSIDESKINLQRYANSQWNKLPTSKSSEDATYVYYEAESPGLSTFAITGEKKAVAVTPPTEEKKCPTCQQESGWSACTNNKQTRTNYRCSSETNHTCQSYTEEQTCKITLPIIPISIPKVSNTWLFIILAAILFLVLFQFKKGKATFRFGKKKKK